MVSSLKFLRSNLSTSQVYSPAHLTRLCFSGPTDGFNNLLIRLRVRRRRLTMHFKSEYKDFICYIRLTCSSQIYILTGVSSDKNIVLCSFLYTVSTMTYGRSTQKPKFVRKTKFIKVQLHSLRLTNVFHVINMWDRFCIHKSNELQRGFCFVLLAVYDMP